MFERRGTFTETADLGTVGNSRLKCNEQNRLLPNRKSSLQIEGFWMRDGWIKWSL